jgi:acyl-ACP thioesterase
VTVHPPWPRGDDRRVTLDQRVRLGDVTPRRRLRLDAVARYLQDVASDDGDDAMLPPDAGWILRRIDLSVGRLPALADDVVLETRCTGLGAGARWAERTTLIRDADAEPDADVAVTSRAVWVYVDLATLAPRALSPEFFAVYGDAVRDHRVSARLTLPKRDPDAARTPWPLRRTDLDVYGHVNNANYWAAVEEWLEGPGARRRITGATIEFGGGLEADDRCDLAVRVEVDATTFWFVVDEQTRAAARVRFAPS